jgi:hypothetical protein
MRIVYDDAQIRRVSVLLGKFLVNQCSTPEKMQVMTRWSYGMERVETPRVRQEFRKFIEEYGFEIGNECDHAGGIGNNNRNPIYFKTPDETQCTGYINVNSDLSGNAYVYITDYNGNRKSESYRLTRTGYTLSR